MTLDKSVCHRLIMVVLLCVTVDWSIDTERIIGFSLQAKTEEKSMQQEQQTTNPDSRE